MAWEPEIDYMGSPDPGRCESVTVAHGLACGGPTGDGAEIALAESREPNRCDCRFRLAKRQPKGQSGGGCPLAERKAAV
jgi:hypothetical protein